MNRFHLPSVKKKLDGCFLCSVFLHHCTRLVSFDCLTFVTVEQSGIHTWVCVIATISDLIHAARWSFTLSCPGTGPVGRSHVSASDSRHLSPPAVTPVALYIAHGSGWRQRGHIGSTRHWCLPRPPPPSPPLLGPLIKDRQKWPPHRHG